MVGLILGAAAFWYYTQNRSSISAVPAKLESVLKDARETVRDQFNAEAMKSELAKTGAIIREKARQAGAAISESAANAKITATIKARYLTERDIPALQIGVDTTDGIVTLSGKVNSPDVLAKAVRLAFETVGVNKVFSTIQIVPEPK